MYLSQRRVCIENLYPGQFVDSRLLGMSNAVKVKQEHATSFRKRSDLYLIFSFLCEFEIFFRLIFADDPCLGLIVE